MRRCHHVHQKTRTLFNLISPRDQCLLLLAPDYTVEIRLGLVYLLISISRIQLMGHTSAGRGVSGTDLVGCVLSLDIPRTSGGGRPPGFYPLRRGFIYRLAPMGPLFRGIPTGPEGFLGMPGASGLRPCARNMCHTCPFSGATDKYRWRICKKRRNISFFWAE